MTSTKQKAPGKGAIIRGKTGKTGPRWAETDIALLNQSVNSLVESVNHIIQALFEGNGEPPILVRLAKVEELMVVGAKNSQSNMEAIGSLTKTVDTLVVGLVHIKTEIDEHPSISRWISMNPWKAMITIAGTISSIGVFLVGAHALLSIPSVQLWFEKLIGLP